MGEADGVRHCDVCDAPIPEGQKRYPLDGGRVCCPSCWKEIEAPRLTAVNALVEIATQWLLNRIVLWGAVLGAAVGFVPWSIAGCHDSHSAVGAALGGLGGAVSGGLLGAIGGLIVSRWARH